MATSASAPQMTTPSSSRRANTTSSPLNSRTSTLRTGVSPKTTTSNSTARRGSIRGSPRTGDAGSDVETSSKDALLTSLKREVEDKEHLLIRVQQRDQTIATLTSDNDTLKNNLNVAEARLSETYADQSRMEEELAARLELVDRLRTQIQELEREKRDITRRYNEQTATFDAERQSFYDNEQHLKSRIQSLVNARKRSSLESSYENKDKEEIPSAISEEDTLDDSLHPAETSSAEETDTGANEPEELPEMISLRLELSTLSTSYTSLQTTVHMLSTQLLDLKRVNNQLQEENESYNILLREKTLNGQFDILRSVGAEQSDDEQDDSDSEDDSSLQVMERSSVRSGPRSILEPVAETSEDLDLHNSTPEDQFSERDVGLLSLNDDEHPRKQSRARRKGTSSPHTQKGESLADLPITGPGLDLAAELGRAENLAMLEGGVDVNDTRERSAPKQKKISKKASVDKRLAETQPDKAETGDLDALRNEVKSLKDANKALSLYASKIIDRIIAQEGFEHVLAVDYEKSHHSTNQKHTQSSKDAPRKSNTEEHGKKRRPQSSFFGSLSIPEVPATTTPNSPVENTATTKAQRRSLSFDWKPFSVWGSTEKKADASNAGLKSLTLRPGSTSVVSGRKLDTHEDEEDRKERERMNATLKLMGIEKPSVPSSPVPLLKTHSSPGSTYDYSSEYGSPKPTSSRFPFFRSKSASETASNASDEQRQENDRGAYLTEEALEHAEAATALMALDAKERVLSAEIAQGSSGGYTDLPPRRRMGEERRSRSKQTSGSGSTVWSAGLSIHRDESGEE